MTELLDGCKEIWIHMDAEVFSRKPSQEETTKIQNRILDNVELKSIEDFAKACGKGKTFKAGVFPVGLNAQKNLITIQVLALDFDNTDSNKKKLTDGYITRSEILKDDFIMNYGAFIYDSFSSARDYQRFRVVFILDNALTDHNEFKELYEKIRNRYPYADAKTCSAANLFYGGKNLQEINYYNLLPVFDILEDASFIEEEKLNSYVVSKRIKQFESYPIYKLLNNGRLQTAKAKMEKFNKTFDSYSSAEHYFLKKDLRVILGFPTQNPFRSPFREDNIPSVSFFKSNVNDNWLYKDAGFMNGKVFDNITLLQDIILKKKSGNYTYRKYSRRETVDLLLDLTSCRVKKTTEQIQISNKIIEIENLLKSPTLDIEKPSIYKVIVKKQYGDLILLILNIFKDSYYEENSKIYHLSWFSSKGLSRKFTEDGMKISEDRIKKALKLMTILEIIKNLTDDDIPKNLLKNIEETRRVYIDKNGVKRNRDKVQVRRSNVYKFNSNISITRLEEICKILLENNYSIRNLNREWLFRYFGKEKADMVFPQNIDIERGISKRSKNFEKAFSQVFFSMLEIRGFVVISKVKWVLRINFGFSDNEFDKHWSRIKKEFCEKYDMNLDKVREDDRFIMGISKKYASRNSNIVYAKYSVIQK